MTKLALVTGASSGIGEVFARKLSAKGYGLILVARRKERLAALAEALPNCEIIQADLADAADLRKVEDRIEAETQLGCLVNNAGFGVHGEFCETPVESQDKMHRLHVIAVERLTHAALRTMMKNRKGNIINVSSVAGFTATPFNVSYCATKTWINAFTEGLYLELKAIHSPVRIQALCPGFTHSEFHKSAEMDISMIPRSLWTSADFVVEKSLRGLERNKLFVIPGWRYRLFSAIYPFVPRWIRHPLSIKYGRARRD
jgi:short-subunit dehydrogenase